MDSDKMFSPLYLDNKNNPWTITKQAKIKRQIKITKQETHIDLTTEQLTNTHQQSVNLLVEKQ
jgi:hypothetical protein